MPTGEEIGKDYPTLMPALTDDANIQEAFVMYHYGLTSYTGIETIPEESIEGHFGAVNERVTALEGRPVAGGIVSPTEPTETGTPPQPIPEGYVWVDSDAISSFSTAWPTVIYSPTDPSASLTMADVGTLWIDENDTTGVLNINNYALLNPSASANQTITNSIFSSPTINSPIITSASVTNATVSGSVDVTANMNVTGRLDVAELRENVIGSSITSNVLTANYDDGLIHYISASPTADFTVNVTNAPTENNKSFIISVMVVQGTTGRIPNAVQIGGAAQTIRWPSNTAPTPTSGAGKIDIFVFTFVRISNSWIVLGNSNLNF